MKILHQLATAILEERDAILVHWRERVRTLPSAAGLDLPRSTTTFPAGSPTWPRPW
jgi:hypothetical protein